MASIIDSNDNIQLDTPYQSQADLIAYGLSDWRFASDTEIVNYLIAQKKNELYSNNLNSATNAVDVVSIPYNGGTFSVSDQNDLTAAAVQMLSGAITVKNWVTNGQILPLSENDIKAIGTQLSSLVDAIWVKWNTFQNNINTASTLDDLNSINLIY